jgi:hypothetical protein
MMHNKLPKISNIFLCIILVTFNDLAYTCKAPSITSSKMAFIMGQYGRKSNFANNF